MASIISMVVLVAIQLSIQAAKSEPLIQDEAWGYVEVRPNAHMFWWFYGAQVKDPAERVQKPLLMWLQGGPGASSTGYGNFAEIGPLDIDLKPRNTTWIKEANIVFVDNPVGCGYSYVTDPSALTTNISGTYGPSFRSCWTPRSVLSFSVLSPSPQPPPPLFHFLQLPLSPLLSLSSLLPPQPPPIPFPPPPP